MLLVSIAYGWNNRRWWKLCLLLDKINHSLIWNSQSSRHGSNSVNTVKRNCSCYNRGIELSSSLRSVQSSTEHASLVPPHSLAIAPPIFTQNTHRNEHFEQTELHCNKEVLITATDQLEYTALEIQVSKQVRVRGGQVNKSPIIASDALYSD